MSPARAQDPRLPGGKFLSLKEFGGSVIVGIGAFLCSLGAVVSTIVFVYGLYGWTDAFHRSDSTRRVLAYAGFGMVTAAGLAVLFGAALWASRRWHVSAVLSVVIAALLAGLAGHEFLFRISLLNDCGLDYSFPYHISGCD